MPVSVLWVLMLMDVLAASVHVRYSDGRKARDGSNEGAQMSFQSKLPSSPQPTYRCARLLLDVIQR